MKGEQRVLTNTLLIFIAGLLLMMLGRQPNEIPPPPIEEKKIDFTLPEDLSFGGQKLELDWISAGQIQKALRHFLDNPSLMCVYIKRAQVDFPFIEEFAAAQNMHSDVKYVATIESGHNSHATSRAGAAGDWQFMERTAKRYGLKINWFLDERRNLKKATPAALSHLKDLLEEFDGDWLLALAAYNAGLARIQQAQKQQGVENYWELSLPAETEFYFAKAIAAKMIMENPSKYGICDELCPPDPRPPTQWITARLEKKTPIYEIAQRFNMKESELKYLNPFIRQRSLPKGEYEILTIK